jgi:predicted dehydrogenase
MKAALLGLTHPHSGILLTTLENLPEVTEIFLWDADPVAQMRPVLPSSRKVKRVTSDLDALLAEPDLVFAIVSVRHDQSAALAQRVLAADKHLLAEKPVGLTSAEILGVQQAAAQAGRVASVLYARRTHPCMVAARQLVQTGALGGLLTAECRFLTTQVKFRQPESWLFNRSQAGGGMLLWLGCHCLDLLQYVSGDEITGVGGLLATLSGEKIDVDDTVALTLRFRSGAIGTFHAGYTLAYSGAGYVNLAGYDSYLGFNGRTGRIVWPDLKPRLQIESAPAPGQSPAREQNFDVPASTSYGGAGGENFFRQFFAAAQGRGEPPTTLADALRTARIIEAAEEASRTGRFVPVAT